MRLLRQPSSEMRSSSGCWVGAFTLTAMAFGSIASAATMNPATPNLANWKTPKYNCFNYGQASKANEFEQIAGYVPVYDATKSGYEAAGLRTAIAANYAGFTDLGSPAAPPATPDGKALVALVCDETKGFDTKLRARYKLDGTGARIPRADGKGFEIELYTVEILKGDFHWYRLNGNGAPNFVWSDKPGETDAKVFVDGAGANVTDPKAAARGRYTTFVDYYSVPAGAAGRPSLTGPDTFDRAGTGASAAIISDSGAPDPASDVSDIQGLLASLPTGPQIADPNWQAFYLADPSGHFGGYSVTPDLGLRSLAGAAHFRVYQGVVEEYLDSDGTSVEFFADNNNLAGFLAGQIVPEPTTFFAIGSMITLVNCRRRRV